MDRLKGKTILVGKEPGQGRMLLAIPETGDTFALGAPDSVPNCVSRCRPADGVAHAKITIDHNGFLTLTNIKSQNVTLVNGVKIVSKIIEPTNVVELGKERFPIDIQTILDAAGKILESPMSGKGPFPDSSKSHPGKFDISHLEHIWNDMQSKRKGILAKQKKINMVRSGCGIFTMCAMPCIFMFGPIGYVLTGIGIIGNIYSFVGLKNDDSSDAIEKMNEEFQFSYVCPNPDCSKFFGAVNYKLLKNQLRSCKDRKMYCPRCGCELTEE